MISIQFLIVITVLIGLVIFVHEFGHFIAAKMCGVKVEEFAFGFWKKIISKKINLPMFVIFIINFGIL